MWDPKNKPETQIGVFTLRPKIRQEGKELQLHLVSPNGTHLPGYWLLKLTKSGILLDGGINSGPGFELAPGKHIRALISDANLNKPPTMDLLEKLTTPSTTEIDLTMSASDHAILLAGVDLEVEQTPPPLPLKIQKKAASAKLSILLKKQQLKEKAEKEKSKNPHSPETSPNKWAEFEGSALLEQITMTASEQVAKVLDLGTPDEPPTL